MAHSSLNSNNLIIDSSQLIPQNVSPPPSSSPSSSSYSNSSSFSSSSQNFTNFLNPVLPISQNSILQTNSPIQLSDVNNINHNNENKIKINSSNISSSSSSSPPTAQVNSTTGKKKGLKNKPSNKILNYYAFVFYSKNFSR